MYEPLHPLEEAVERWPGIDLQIDGTSVCVRVSSWRGGTSCFAAFDFKFRHALAGLYVFDETTNFEGQVAMPQEQDFLDGASRAHPLWLDRSGSRLSLYGEYGAMNYKNLSSYCFIGQSIVVVLDIADAEPEITRVNAAELMV